MKPFLFAVAALLTCCPIRADFLPTYSYVYSCDSGVVDCNAFPKHWYGDYGYPQADTAYMWPNLGSSVPIYGSSVVASNSKGDAIGYVIPRTSPLFYGASMFDGKIYGGFIYG